MFDLFACLPRLPQMASFTGKLASPAQNMMVRARTGQQAWPGAVIGRLVDHLLNQGSFAEALSRVTGFTSRRGTDGIICLRNETHLCGAILTPRSAALQFAVTGAEAFAGSTLTTLLQSRFGTLPAWHGTAAGVEIGLHLAPGMTLAIRVADASVDPLFIGRQLPGLSVDLSVELSD